MNLVEFTMRIQSSFIPAVRVEATAFDFQKRRTFSMRSSLVADEI
jgi:hypothetical protein